MCLAMWLIIWHVWEKVLCPCTNGGSLFTNWKDSKMLSRLRRNSCSAVSAWVTSRKANSLVAATCSIWDVWGVGWSRRLSVRHAGNQFNLISSQMRRGLTAVSRERLFCNEPKQGDNETWRDVLLACPLVPKISCVPMKKKHWLPTMQLGKTRRTSTKPNRLRTTNNSSKILST